MSETRRISRGIPGPTFDYLLGRSAVYQKKKDDALRTSLAGGGLGSLLYVDRYGQNDSEMAFLRQKAQRMCRYHMRYTGVW